MTSTPSENSLQVMAKEMVSPQSSSNSLNHLIRPERANKPIGISLFGSCFNFSTEQSKQNFHKALVLLLTFIAYAAFHMGRRPFSIVKNVLNRDCSKFYNRTTTDNIGVGGGGVDTDPLLDNDYPEVNATYLANPYSKDTSCDWAPFNDDATANKLLAYLDTAFLASYAICMFGSGVIAERTNLRYLITLGMMLSGLSLIAFGVSYQLDIHSMFYFILIQIFAGAAQSTGWPVVVTCVGNWFDDSSRGTVYGIWNSHTNLGNILGATIAGYFVESDWGLSFIWPGVIMIVVGIILFLFLVPSPKDVNLRKPDENLSIETREAATIISAACQKPTELNSDLENNKVATISPSGSHEKLKAVSFMTALKIPGVIEYSFCLFFSKLVSYTFLYWLPRYIASSTTNNSEHSAYLSTPFDIGGIAGAILAGHLSDRFKVNGIICNIMLLMAIPSMFSYQKFGAYSSMHNILLQLVVGLLVNGPYCLITTSVSADLGYRIKDGHAMATVSAIIDGMGSVGAVLGPLFAGLVPEGDWSAVFLMLMLSDVLAALCIARITIQDIKSVFCSTKPSSG
uniref:Sugar phosphate exchanger 2 n=1 Tax=Aceria tosichella TaxID=561515 RepID=A0A6G1SLU5_9ACAR